ncbi:unnamed protein product, partial [Rotaria sordida]
MTALENERINEKILFPDIALLDKSKSLHASSEGKVWVRLAINLCWWIHDMYEVVGNDSNAKLNYIKNKAQCSRLFPARFLLMVSDPECMPNEQHPFLICRQDDHKTILSVFRATVSSKSIQDVFTDLKFYSNREVYEGDRHSGFSERTHSGPLVAVVNWLRQGWKVIVTGHSLGGAVSQLFTAEVIRSLAEIGLTIDQVVLRCITFGVPQCADYRFWSHYTAWYDVFDTYIYENDAIFRLVMFGADLAKKTVNAFVGYIGNLVLGIIEYMNNDSLVNNLQHAADQIGDIINDALIPTYSVFGRHHFIVKDRQALLKIISIGDLDDDKKILLNCLVDEKNHWYKFFIDKGLIPVEPFKFVYRQFQNHGCYPFAINQLFNEEATRRLGSRNCPTLELLRSPLDNSYSKSVFNLSAFIYSQNEDFSNPDYIYLKGFLVHFIRSVELPFELVESEQYRKQKVVMTQEQSDGRAVSCFKSPQAKEFIKRHSTFFIEITTYFGSCSTRVAVLSNVTNSMLSNVYDLDPVSTVLRAYYELVLDASSAEQYNESALSRSFSNFFDSFKHIDYGEGDTILARYLAELQSVNYMDNVEKYLENLKIPQSDEDLYKYLKKELKLLEKTSGDTKHTSDEMQWIYATELPPLHLEFTQLQKYLRELHNRREIDIIQNTLKSVMASFFFLKIKLNRLAAIFRNHSYMQRILLTLRRVYIERVFEKDRYFSRWLLDRKLLNEITKTLAEIAVALLLSTGERINKSENEWQILIRLVGCCWLDDMTKVKTEQVRDVLWSRTFTKEPLIDVPNEHRWNWIGLIQLCSQVVLMREILISKPPKVVLSGRSQTGKSTLFKYLTGRNL